VGGEPGRRAGVKAKLLHESQEVLPALEAIVTESPPPLRRRVDPKSGLALLEL
jgi:hypothetical protein